MGRIENIVGKGENAGYQQFLLFLKCSPKACFPESLKVRTVWKRVKSVKIYEICQWQGRKPLL